MPPPKAREMNLGGELGVICVNIPSLETLLGGLSICLKQTWEAVVSREAAFVSLYVVALPSTSGWVTRPLTQTREAFR